MKITLNSIKSLFRKTKKQPAEQKQSTLTREQSAYIQKALDEFWYQSKPFLKHRYSLHDLSNKINIPVHQLSFFFNKEKKMSFSDFVNQYRIYYCLEYLQKSKITKVDIKDLSSLCGFNNRNTFTAPVGGTVTTLPTNTQTVVINETTNNYY